MTKRNPIAIYEENQINILNKLSFYKNLGVDTILVNPFSSIDTDRVAELITLSENLKTADLKLMVKLDIIEVSRLLLGEKDIDFSLPKIRNSLYQFMNYLIKHGILGFYITNLSGVYENLKTDKRLLATFTRELKKNTLVKKGVVSVAEVNKPSIEALKFLSGKDLANFTYIAYSYGGKEDFLDLKKQLYDYAGFDSQDEISSLYTLNMGLENHINEENYPYHSYTLRAGITYFLGPGIKLSGYEEMGLYSNPALTSEYKMIKSTESTLSFYRKLLRSRADHPEILSASFRPLFIKDLSIIGYQRAIANKKLLVFGNFSQKEVLCDIRFHFLELYDYKYLLGNYGLRRITKNLLLRPYEFVSFIIA